MNLIANKKELILVYAGMEPISPTKSVNVLLTPQFYTLKKEILPIKYLYQAKKIAPSLFEGLLERNWAYEYFVFKEEDAWVFIAYSIKRITDFLSKKGIKPEKISKLYFAQQALEILQNPVSLGEREILAVIDNTAVVIPAMALSEMPQTGMFNSNFAPSRGVSLHDAYGSILSLSQAVVIAGVLIVFGIMYVVEGMRHGQASKQQQREIEELTAIYPSLQSKYARESIASKYKAIDAKERKKRETIKALSAMIFKGVALSSLQIDEKNFKARFVCRDERTAKQLQGLAKKEQFNTSIVPGSTDVQIEGAL